MINVHHIQQDFGISKEKPPEKSSAQKTLSSLIVPTVITASILAVVSVIVIILCFLGVIPCLPGLIMASTGFVSSVSFIVLFFVLSKDVVHLERIEISKRQDEFQNVIAAVQEEKIDFKHPYLTKYFANGMLIKDALAGVFVSSWAQTLSESLQIPKCPVTTPQERLEREFLLVLLSYCTVAEIKDWASIFCESSFEGEENCYEEFVENRNYLYAEGSFESFFLELEDWLRAVYPEVLALYKREFSKENRAVQFVNYVKKLGKEKTSPLFAYSKFLSSMDIFKGRQARMLASLPLEFDLRALQALIVRWEEFYTLCLSWHSYVKIGKALYPGFEESQENWMRFVLNFSEIQNNIPFLRKYAELFDAREEEEDLSLQDKQLLQENLGRTLSDPEVAYDFLW
ncbi:hypothetical protein [Chlamydiifrater phoenicopteri]|uniref:hypothetical protein n=1 Tax=Chlamydiifrater phoenicopteri TaxID=2681469 RepID=UPI001BCD75AE|nr:hypothetical protein [Chlamydiifrater phoenicopteri]